MARAWEAVCIWAWRAQPLPRSDGYRRFTGSPIDALVYLVGLSCQIPTGSPCAPSSTGASQPSHSGGPRAGVMCGGRLHPDVVQDGRISALWVMKAMMRICPPHMGHSSGNAS